MDDVTDLKQEQESDTVNFENLHANMALEDPGGVTTTTNKEEIEKVSDGESGTEQTVNDNGSAGDRVIRDHGNDEIKQVQVGSGNSESSGTQSNDVNSKGETGSSEAAELRSTDVGVTGSQEKTSFEEAFAEPSDVEEVAKDIIKNAVDSATEQVFLEKFHGDEKKPVQETGETPEATKKEPEWLDILGNGLLKKKILKAGRGPDSRPLRESEVTIRYEARLSSDDEGVVESEENYTFVVGEQDVIAAFDLALALMEKGEVALLESDAKYAFEEEGKPPKIPPNASLIFTIELLDVRPGPFSAEIELDRRLAWADQKRQKGNLFYSDKKYVQASMAYTRATKALEKGWLNEQSEQGRIQINELRLKCYNNLCASRMKEEKWKEAMQSCRAAELLEPNNVKTLFRKGKIHCELGELNKGVAVLSKAEKLDPDNKVIASEHAKQKRRAEKQKESQKKMYRRMLGTTSEENSSKSSQTRKQEGGWFRNWGRVIGGTLAIGAVLVGVYIAQRS